MKYIFNYEFTSVFVVCNPKYFFAKFVFVLQDWSSHALSIDELKEF